MALTGTVLTLPPSAAQALEPFYDKLDPAFLNVRKVVREVLQKEEDLNEIVQLVGKVGSPALSPCRFRHILHGSQQWHVKLRS